MTFQYYPPQLLQKARETYWGELAWHVCDIPDVLEYAHSENLVILGGDVITPYLRQLVLQYISQPHH